MKHYTMYHCHSMYSILDSATHYQDYVELAKRDGMTALSISEHGKPLNWCEKWNACKQAGIKYMHSVEIYLTESLEQRVRDNYHTVLIARNMDGLRELNAAISRSCDPDHFYYVNRMTFEEFLALSDNIISTSACLASPLCRFSPDNPMYERLARKYTFLEIQPHVNEDQAAYNLRLLELSRRIGTPLIAATDTHSSSRYKAECRSVLLESKNKSYGDEDTFDLTWKTREELEEMFARQGVLPSSVFIEAIDNTNLLEEMTEPIELDTSIKYPILHGSREEDTKRFEEAVWHGLESKVETGVIPKSQEPAFKEALTEELRVFKKLEMCGFMLSMSELVSWCKSQGMAIGTARGSVGGSRAAYVTDIIDLNPETWHTIFSRFANEDRREIGDIDIDCVESDRPAIFQYIMERFGRSKTARVASFGTDKEKGVIDDVGRCLAKRWEAEVEKDAISDKKSVGKSANPWSLDRISAIKAEFDADPEATKKKYPELFYYFDGLLGCIISQSVHPAGMVISPITLDDNFGVFDKDGEPCLMLDMDNVHDFTGLAKYDFLILSTVTRIRDTCGYIGIPYPKTHEIDWCDSAVWESMTKSNAMIFQMESDFAFTSIKKMHPQSIEEMSLISACMRPGGASYRDDLLERKRHSNPDPLIDKLLEGNLGYLVYQEDTIAFLQQICGLSGSDADTVRRAIGRKKREYLDKMMPRIIDGYCNKSTKPREEAEQDVKEFLQILEDSASYQFGYNHSVAYCLLGYLCAYYRHYYPLEFITAFLNNAANDDDIVTGTEYARKQGIKIMPPKYGHAKSGYFFSKDDNAIVEGLNSVKFMSSGLADELFRLSEYRTYDCFVDLLTDIFSETSCNAKQLDILIKIDFFSAFGNQRELLRIADMFLGLFKKGEASRISRDKVDGTPLEPLICQYATGTTKAGTPAKNYTITDIYSLMRAAESVIRDLHLDDLSTVIKARNYADIMGRAGYVSGLDSDRPKLYISAVYPLKRKSDGKKFGVSVVTQSIGSGKEARFTVLNKLYNVKPIKAGDIIICYDYSRNNGYFRMEAYDILSSEGGAK